MSVSDFFKAAPRGMLISVAIAFVLLNGLGIWQWSRMQWKEGVIAAMTRTEAMPPVSAASLLKQPKIDWRSVSLPSCAFDGRHLIAMHSEVAGVPGYRMLAACPLGDHQTNLLVDLGFATQPLGAAQTFTFAPVGRLRPFEKAGMVTPVNRPADHDWYWREPSEMGQALGAPVRSDYFLVVDLTASRASVPGLQQGPLNPSVAVPPSRHFEYALTWFGLAWVMLGMFIAFVLQKRQGAAA